MAFASIVARLRVAVFTNVREDVPLRLFLAICVVLWSGFGPALAETRIALVIGNGAYARIGALLNPPADARLIAETLESLGFETSLLLDTDQDSMKRQIAEFGRKLRGAGEDATGLFYYAGHGIQAEGRNYLLPVEAAPSDQADLDLMGVDANWILRQMESAGNRTNVVILDACRNNPFAVRNRSISRGLARMDAPTGSFIAYATAPGDTAEDGDGANSPFTLALAEALPTPGMAIEQLFKKVRVDVIRATGGRQTPWDSSSLVDDFSFNEASIDAAAGTAPRPVEFSLWQSVSNSGDAGRLALFLQVYPNSRFAPEARALLADTLATDPSLVVGEVIDTDQVNALHDAPATTRPAEAAPEVRNVPSEHELIARAQASKAVADYETYLEAYPRGVFADLARAEVSHLIELAMADPAGADAPAAIDPDSVLLFDQPLATDSGAERRSLHQLARASPAFPPVEGLRQDYWAEKNCSNCHNWSRDNLCRQGKFYTDTDAAALARIKHPFGGFFKNALKKWAVDGCQ